MLKEISTSNFDQEVLQSEIPVLADLWAPWCGPCKALTPTVEAVANEYKGNLKVVKINVDDNPSLAAKYSVMSIPTLLFFKDGRRCIPDGFICFARSGGGICDNHKTSVSVPENSADTDIKRMIVIIFKT